MSKITADYSLMYDGLLEVHDRLKLDMVPGRTDKENPKKYISKVYGPILDSQRDENLKMVEIGVRGGASIKLWLTYFRKIKLIGIDIIEIDNSIINNDYLSSTNQYTYLRGNAYSKNILTQLPNGIDVVIDDGPHTLETQIYLLNYLDLMNTNGLIFIEDIQNPYWIDEIINQLPPRFMGCVRLFDLRKESGIEDAMVILIHNCMSSKCTLKNGVNLNNSILKRVSKFKIRKKIYIGKRSILRIVWKIKYELSKF